MVNSMLALLEQLIDMKSSDREATMTAISVGDLGCSVDAMVLRQAWQLLLSLMYTSASIFSVLSCAASVRCRTVVPIASYSA